MEHIRINRRINNLEIISKLMNSVAKRYGCRIKYDPSDRSLKYYGETSYQKYIAQETLSFFQRM